MGVTGLAAPLTISAILPGACGNGNARRHLWSFFFTKEGGHAPEVRQGADLRYMSPICPLFRRRPLEIEVKRISERRGAGSLLRPTEARRSSSKERFGEISGKIKRIQAKKGDTHRRCGREPTSGTGPLSSSHSLLWTSPLRHCLKRTKTSPAVSSGHRPCIIVLNSRKPPPQSPLGIAPALLS